MSAFPGLDRLDAMQRAPLGTYSALNRPSPAASQYKRQAALYGQAMRSLTRAARRGNPDAALKAIAVSDQAMEKGISTGGIRQYGEMEAGAQGFQQSLEQRATDMEARSRLDRRFGEEALNAPRTVNPNATPGAGYGTPTGGNREEPTSSRTRPTESELQKRDRLTREGAFGSGAANRLKRRNSSDRLSTETERQRRMFGGAQLA